MNKKSIVLVVLTIVIVLFCCIITPFVFLHMGKKYTEKSVPGFHLARYEVTRYGNGGTVSDFYTFILNFRCMTNPDIDNVKNHYDQYYKNKLSLDFCIGNYHFMIDYGPEGLGIKK